MSPGQLSPGLHFVGQVYVPNSMSILDFLLVDFDLCTLFAKFSLNSTQFQFRLRLALYPADPPTHSPTLPNLSNLLNLHLTCEVPQFIKLPQDSRNVIKLCQTSSISYLPTKLSSYLLSLALLGSSLLYL